MISLRNVSLAFGGQELFDGASLQINEGDRLALVGPNGAGKSTIFKLILGELEPDRGAIQVKKGLTLGHLPQENAPVSDQPVLAAALAGSDPDDARLAAQAKAILMGLGFRIADFGKPVRTLSGGWAMRVAMARLLLQAPDLLLLDEPTNHLDLWSLLWFRDYLTEYRGTILLISHDRAFINTICHAVVSVQDRELQRYEGDYEHFVRERATEIGHLESAKRAQDGKMAQMQEFIDRNRARLSTARRAQSMMKRLEKVERIELPPEPKTLSMRLPQPPPSGKEVMKLKGLSKSYGHVAVYRGLDFAVRRGDRRAFVGPNGAGKSTLLKSLAGVLPFESGERVVGHNVVVGYHAQHREGTMDPKRTVLEEAMSTGRNLPPEFVRTVLGSFLFSEDAVFKQVKVLSGGEKSRLSLVKVLLDPPNFLLLDEPTTHLDITSVASLVAALSDYEGTLAFISHDLHFINTLSR
ncbi:MAG: ABC-F family ATP-binding cassette domain-containing protein, partial [bacterium]